MREFLINFLTPFSMIIVLTTGGISVRNFLNYSCVIFEKSCNVYLNTITAVILETLVARLISIFLFVYAITSIICARKISCQKSKIYSGRCSWPWKHFVIFVLFCWVLVLVQFFSNFFSIIFCFCIWNLKWNRCEKFEITKQVKLKW